MAEPDKDSDLYRLIGKWTQFKTEGEVILSDGILRMIDNTIIYLLELAMIKQEPDK